MKKNKLLRYLIRLLLFSLPFIIIFIAYLIMDPFMVLYNYDSYNKNPYIQKNTDFVSTEKFINNSDSIIYDSFIFGGSTAYYISPQTWKNYISTENQVYSFFASAEHITGIWSKIKYIDHHDHHLNNALLVFDIHATFGRFVNDNPTFMKHYEVYPSSGLNFQYGYLLNFINFRWLVPYLHYRLTNNYLPYMRDKIINIDYNFDPQTNEYFNTEIRNILKNDSLQYYQAREDRFGEQAGKYAPIDVQIKPEYIDMLNEIKSIFIQHGTDYRILMSPASNQKAFNPKDLMILQSIFGKEYVVDFSGINEITKDISNFYDEYHFKKYVGKELLDIMYSENTADLMFTSTD